MVLAGGVKKQLVVIAVINSGTQGTQIRMVQTNVFTRTAVTWASSPFRNSFNSTLSTNDHLVFESMRTGTVWQILRGLIELWQQRATSHRDEVLKRKGVRRLEDQLRRHMQVKEAPGDKRQQHIIGVANFVLGGRISLVTAISISKVIHRSSEYLGRIPTE